MQPYWIEWAKICVAIGDTRGLGVRGGRPIEKIFEEAAHAIGASRARETVGAGPAQVQAKID
jgi:hypothetical protein